VPKDPSLIPAPKNKQQAVQRLIDIELPQLLGLPIQVALPPTHVSLQQKRPFTMNLQAHLVLEERVMEEAERLNEVVLGDMEPTSRQRNDQFQRTAALKYGFLGS